MEESLAISTLNPSYAGLRFASMGHTLIISLWTDIPVCICQGLIITTFGQET